MSVRHGDMRLILPGLEPDSVDACVTDPPYEIGFMGKAWDRSGVAFDPATWAAVFRVLEPGARLLAFCGSGTTGIAAQRERRRFLGVEIDPETAQLAREERILMATP